MKYRIEIENLESDLSESEIYRIIDDAMLDIADNYGEVCIDVTEDGEDED